MVDRLRETFATNSILFNNANTYVSRERSVFRLEFPSENVARIARLVEEIDASMRTERPVLIAITRFLQLARKVNLNVHPNA